MMNNKRNSSDEAHKQRLKELGTFLKHRREQLKPEQFGFSRHARNRAKGLTRAEVARALNICEDVYRRIEQGIYRSITTRLLERVVQVLNLFPHERTYVFHLAGLVPHINHPQAEEVAPALQRLLDEYAPCPAYLMNKQWDLIRWNQSTMMAFPFFAHMCGIEPPPIGAIERNIPYIIFTDPLAQQVIIDWEVHARRVVKEFRASFGQHSMCAQFAKIKETLLGASPQFKQWWDEQHVDKKTTIRKEIQHPTVGRLVFEQTAYCPTNAPELILVHYIPLDDETREKLKQ